MELHVSGRESAGKVLGELWQRCLPTPTLRTFCDELRRGYFESNDRDPYLLTSCYALKELAVELKIEHGVPGTICARLADQSYRVACTLMETVARWEEAIESRRANPRVQVEELWNQTIDSVKLFGEKYEWSQLDNWITAHANSDLTQRLPVVTPSRMRILFLAANPLETSRLDLEKELRSLEQELRGVRFRDSITLVARHAVRPDDLIRHVREHKPNVVHFSGHGSQGGVFLCDDAGGSLTVSGQSLT